MTATVLVPGFLPFCNTPDFNCDELGGFLYSIEVTEGVAPCKTILPDGNIAPNPSPLVCA